MRRKRLKHISFILCHMFCGWRLTNSYREITELGNGQLVVDIINAKCYFNEKEIHFLNIAEELRAWFHKELTDNNINLEQIYTAELRASLTLDLIERKKRITLTQYFFNEKHMKPAKLYQCKIDCKSKIATDDAEYIGKFADIEAWPANIK